MWKLWANLEGAIREGTHRWQQTFGWDGPIFSHFFRTDDALREFLMGMHGYGLISSPQVVAAFDLGRFRRLVNLGGATGHLAIAACQRYATLRPWSSISPVPSPWLARSSARRRSRIESRSRPAISSWTPCRRLTSSPSGASFTTGRNPRSSTSPGAFTTGFRPAGRCSSRKSFSTKTSAVLDGLRCRILNMLTCTEGKERTLAEYEAVMEQVGFSEVFGAKTPSPLDAILAVKR